MDFKNILNKEYRSYRFTGSVLGIVLGGVFAQFGLPAIGVALGVASALVCISSLD